MALWLNFDHQLKLMDSKCRLSAKPDEQILATSCLIFLGPHTNTPTSDSLDPNRISAILYYKQKTIIINFFKTVLLIGCSAYNSRKITYF